MKNLLPQITIILGLTFAINTNASLLINANSDKTHYQSGEKAIFTGSIQSFVTGNNDFSRPPIIANQPGILNPLSYKAFYPDMLTEVTNQLTYNQNTGAFSYTSPAVISPINAKNNDAAFIIEVGKASPFTRTLQITKAQLDARITALQKEINELIELHFTTAQIAPLNNTLAVFKESSAVLKEEINAANEIIARRKVPLQVDSTEANDSTVMSLMQNGLRYEITWQNGVVFQNQSTNVTTTVTHVAQLETSNNSAINH